MSEERVRVIAPEVGGGFGSKLQVYPEEVMAAWASRKLDRPIKWIETRTENMAVTHQGRDQIDYVRMGAKRDGTITAWHAKIIADLGAYNMLLTPAIPSLGAFVMSGVYKIPAVHTDIVGVFTNKCPTDAIRGAGRPEATHMIEVSIDQVAAELGMDPLEIRRKNFIPKEDFPAETAFAQIVADKLGVDPSVVEVMHGDTGTGPEGRNTYGSRSLAVGGESLARCATKIADKAKAIVAHHLEAAPEDIELHDGKFSVRGSPDKGMTMGE